MLFHSLEFFVFFPVVVLVYFLVPKKVRYIWLLAASYYFYMSWNAWHLLLIFCSTFITWASGLFIAACRKETGSGMSPKLVVAISFAVNIGILAVFKYFDFILYNVNIITGAFGWNALEKPIDIILPAGISFYTFQALGYTVDVYRKAIEPERNLLKYALFVSFFPQLVAGPIERSKHFLSQINKVGELDFKMLFDCDRIAAGLVLMLWGYFQKLVIADRVSILVDTVYNSVYFYGTVELLMATVAFSIQIYCDFASYSTIAAGAAKVLGFELTENFNTPYFSASIREFWRRWHISLSTWFKDYLYIPLGGNRCGRIRRHVNIMVTFLVSGLWHGASWHYVVWGAVHGVFHVVGDEMDRVRKRISSTSGLDGQVRYGRMGQVVATYGLIVLSLILFRSETLPQALYVIKRILTKPNPWALTDGTLYKLGLDDTQAGILITALAALFLVSFVRYWKKETLDVFLARQCIGFRWLAIIGLFSFTFLFGIYGPEYDESQFLYFQF